MTKRARLAALAFGCLILSGGAANAAGTFSTPVELCTDCGNHDIAVDASGKVYAAWSTTGGFALWTSLDGGNTFSRVSGPNSAITGLNGNIAVASTGNVIHLVWIALDLAGPQVCDIPGIPGFQPSPCYDVFYARSLDGGKTFSAPTNISQAYFGVYGPRIAIDSTGTVVNVVWNQATTGYTNICCAREIYFSRSTDGGNTFSLPQNISGPLQDSLDVDIAVDTWGGVINVVWYLNSPTGFPPQIYFVRSPDGGITFSAPKSLAEGQVPSIATDTTGGVINIAYTQSGIRFVRSTNGGEGFSSPKPLSTSGYRPRLAADVYGNRIDVVWAEAGGAKSIIRFTRSSNGGQSFSRPITISSSKQYAVRPDLAVDSAGNVNAIWAVWDGYPFVYPFIPEVYYARGGP